MYGELSPENKKVKDQMMLRTVNLATEAQVILEAEGLHVIVADGHSMWHDGTSLTWGGEDEGTLTIAVGTHKQSGWSRGEARADGTLRFVYQNPYSYGNKNVLAKKTITGKDVASLVKKIRAELAEKRQEAHAKNQRLERADNLVADISEEVGIKDSFKLRSNTPESVTIELRGVSKEQAIAILKAAKATGVQL